MLFDLFNVALFISLAAADLVRVGNMECEEVRQYNQCLPRWLATAPGVGIHLAAEYGAVSASYHNGTVVDIARIDASLQFANLMAKLADPYFCSKTFTSTQRFMHTLTNPRRWDIPNLFSRSPSNPTDLLTEMLTQLRIKAEEHLNTAVTHVQVILPDLPGLTYNTLEEAAGYSGLTLLQGFTASSSHSSLTYAALAKKKKIFPTLTTAAYVATRKYGLCKNYTDPEACNRQNVGIEKSEELTRGILRISLDSQTLSIDGGECNSATTCFGSTRSRNLEDMGYHSSLRRENPTRYWNTIADMILQAGVKTGSRGLDFLMLMGDYVLEQDFLDSLEMALLYVDGGAEIIDQLRSDGYTVKYEPVFLAARGAAEMAKRIAAGQKVYSGDEGCEEQGPREGVNINEQEDI
ncbi:hypothetical protein TWF694_002841 [Orbilia ellipsospora]|uniref:Uncharacterized protein n=1 Tax=Orbilia ellipsospora TaxID=2528407 RepID=A0AAV9X264_9PEZI